MTSLTVADPRFKPWFGPAGETDFTPNTLNQYTQAGGTTLTYTTAGNLQSDGTRGFSYDSLNRLRGSGSADLTQGPSTTYGYDALGRRVSKTFSGISTAFLYAGDRIIAEYSASGQLAKRFIYGPGIDEPVAMILVNQGVETKYYYHADRLGSIIALTNSNGDLVESYNYTPYGQPYKPSSLGNPFLYTGRDYDSESGLYHYRARAYDPILRRFLQPDPIGFTDSMNLYAYVGNGPLNAVDPYGQFAIVDDALIIGGALIIGAASYAMQTPEQRQRMGNDLRRLWDAIFMSKPKSGGTGCNSSGGESSPGTPDPNDPDKMFGSGGTQVTSKTLWERKGIRIDVENPNPGQRPGQIHLQAGGDKYYYDPLANQFRGAPKAINRLLEDQSVQRAITRGLKILGEL